MQVLGLMNLDRIRRAEEIAQLRRAGLTFVEIGKRLKLSASRVRSKYHWHLWAERVERKHLERAQGSIEEIAKECLAGFRLADIHNENRRMNLARSRTERFNLKLKNSISFLEELTYYDLLKRDAILLKSAIGILNRLKERHP